MVNSKNLLSPSFLIWVVGGGETLRSVDRERFTLTKITGVTSRGWGGAAPAQVILVMSLGGGGGGASNAPQ